MEQELIYRSYRQGGKRYENIVSENGQTLKLDFEENLFISAAPLWDQLTPSAVFKPLDVKSIFGNANPLSVEIGIGNGEFLAHHAALDADINWLGFEVFHKIFEKAVSRCHKTGCSNVRMLQFDAEFFVRLLPENSVDAFYVNFPDPWPKARHTKRRLLKPWFIELIASRLVKGGVLTVATDHSDYAAEITENFKEVKALQSMLGALYLNDMGDYYQTKYFRKFAANDTVYFYRMQKK